MRDGGVRVSYEPGKEECSGNPAEVLQEFPHLSRDSVRSGPKSQYEKRIRMTEDVEIVVDIATRFNFTRIA